MFSSSCKYGIRAVMYIASQQRDNGRIGIQKISKDLDLPTPYLAKILQLLAKQKILSSTKGPHGGFSLLKDAKNITLFDIVGIIDGDNIFNNCIIHNIPCKCMDSDKTPCPIHADYYKVRTSLIKLFRSKTIFNLVKAVKSKEEISI